MFAALQTLVVAWTQTAQAINAALTFWQAQQTKQAGIDAQKVVELEAENTELRLRLAALMAASGTPGSAKL